MSVIWILKLRVTRKKVFTGGFSLNDWGNHISAMMMWAIGELILGYGLSYFSTVSLKDFAISGALTGLIVSLTCCEDDDEKIESA
jgi:hypothetical protein